MIIGLVIWLLVSLIFLGLGVFSFKADKPVGFWSNVKPPEVENVKAYNCAVGKLWCVFAVVFALLGFPFLVAEQNSPLFFISIVGVMLEVIVVAVVYTVKIESKYRKK
ncbi:MAG: hypothetical protein J6C01_08615 [Lachnospiraceae bacterium]|nr:hypothetical protein [Lachnospiraceae bacterium]